MPIGIHSLIAHTIKVVDSTAPRLPTPPGVKASPQHVIHSHSIHPYISHFLFVNSSCYPQVPVQQNKDKHTKTHKHEWLATCSYPQLHAVTHSYMWVHTKTHKQQTHENTRYRRYLQLAVVTHSYLQ